MISRLVLGLALLLAGALVVPELIDPCGRPLTYRLGEIDLRFGITPAQLREALQDAEAVWEPSAKLNLFEYADDGRIAVHLVYDERQKTAEDIVKRKDVIDAASESADSVKRRHEAASAKYETARDRYQKARAEHDSLLAEHNRDVAAWNARGGAKGNQYDLLRREEAALKETAAELELERKNVNELAETANALSDRFNKLANTVNANVEAINENAGQEFKQGRYVRDGNGESIYVFEFIGKSDLVHLLAHELGHALGLEHDANREAIMYGLNSTQTLVPTPSDVEALRARCRL